jgi:hypothetical protein
MDHTSPAAAKIRAAVFSFLLAAAAAAQAPVGLAARVPATGESWRVPIHTGPTDPTGGEYGTWAVGRDYKVSFHDGFVFYPLLGKDHPENLPLRWTTERVRVGGLVLADGGARPEHHRQAWRYEYRYGTVTEAYDVRADGVEQSFVVHVRPACAGDLVVEGRFATRLSPAASLVQAAHAALTFADAAGQPLVRYGKAFAIDALGRSTPVTTGFDGARVQLTVPAAWLEHAAFPVVVDPLTSRVAIAADASFARYEQTVIAREEESPTSNVMIAYAREFSASDHDVIALLGGDDLTGAVPVYTDVTASWSTEHPDLAFVGGADRWLVAFHRDFADGTERVRVYFHDKSNTNPNSGVTRFHDPVAGEDDVFAAVGGRASFAAGTDALLVYASRGLADLWGLIVDAGNRTLGVRSRINPVNLDVTTAPDVSSAARDGESWMIAYTAWTDSSDDSDVYVARVDAASLPFAVSFRAGIDTTTPRHKGLARIEGGNQRYLLAMNLWDTPFVIGPIEVQRIDWPHSSVFPTFGAVRRLAAFTGTRFHLAFDSTSASHWCLVHQWNAPTSHVWRLGLSGAPTEDVPLAGGESANHPSVAYRSATREFQIVYGGYHASGAELVSQSLAYPPEARNVRRGTGCQNTSNTFSADPPYAGSEFFTVRLTGQGTGRACVLLVSLAYTSVPLDFLGMTGCTLHADPSPGQFLFSLPTVSVAGLASVRFALPDDPLFQSNLYGQWLWLQRDLNPAGAGTSHGLEVRVR